jgi:chromate transport protein ChrA
MCSFENLPGPIEIFYISLIGTFFYFWLKPHFTGFGGKLGVIALLSSVVVVFSRGLW